MCCVLVMTLLHCATYIIRVCSEIFFSEGLCHVETSHLIFDPIRLTGFCDLLLGSITEQTMIHFCLLGFLFFFEGTYR